MPFIRDAVNCVYVFALSPGLKFIIIIGRSYFSSCSENFFADHKYQKSLLRLAAAAAAANKMEGGRNYANNSCPTAPIYSRTKLRISHKIYRMIFYHLKCLAYCAVVIQPGPGGQPPVVISRRSLR